MSFMRLKGKVCVITASTSGIGLAIAKRLGAEGAKVVTSSRKQENVDKAVEILKSEGIREVHGVACHVAKESDRKKLFAEAISKFGGIDVLVSNAGANPANSSVLQTSSDQWDKIFDVNVKASFSLAKEVKPHLVKQGGGSIVFMSTVLAYQQTEILGAAEAEWLQAYAVSKTALIGLTKAAAIECAKDNIRVNCVAPGLIETKFAAKVSKRCFFKAHSRHAIFLASRAGSYAENIRKFNFNETSGKA